VFERHREKRAAREYQQQLTGWQQQRDGCAEALEIARTYTGEPAYGIMLKPGERVFAGMAGSALIEDRRVQGATTATAIDTGTVYVTNMRVIFQGTRQTRECLFSKLVAFQHDDQTGTTVFSVSNRQKPMTVRYGHEMSAWFDFRLDLALAHYRSDLAAFVAQLQNDLANLDAHKPLPPIVGAA
jgi:hypothetical protein